MCKLDVVEKFVSINGEGTKAGQLAVFIRFKGCNLACEYCDTQWANQADAPAQQMTAEEIVDYVISTGVKNVTLTGGEPLLSTSTRRCTPPMGGWTSTLPARPPFCPCWCSPWPGGRRCPRLPPTPPAPPPARREPPSSPACSW